MTVRLWNSINILLFSSGRHDFTWCQELKYTNMSKFNPPKELSFEGNLSENWERWKKEFKFYLTATESDKKGDDVKTSRLLGYSNFYLHPPC